MRIIHAKPFPAYRLELQFDSGETGVVEVSSLVGRGVFAAWNSPRVFEQVAVTDFGAVEWPGQIDLCPDALYMQMTGKKPDEVFLALRNRVSHV